MNNVMPISNSFKVARASRDTNKTIVRPAMMYGADTWAVKNHERARDEVGRKNEDVEMDVWSHNVGRIRKQSYGITETIE